jgi:ABC-type nitrate/sulfonate/bicarbonate transport system substrate-binding protein
LATASVLVLSLSACGDDGGGSASADEGSGENVEVRLGYFPNLTHGTALVGLAEGSYEDALSEDGATLTAQDFNSGSDTIEALLGGGLDATYIGPSPTITAYTQSEGQDNSVTVQAFQQGDIAGAWVPEPYVTILEEAGGKVLVDEAELWPDGEFVTTQLIVRTEFLEEHPDLVEDLLNAHVESTTFINESPNEAKTIIGEELLELTQSKLPADVMTSAFDKLTFTNDPLASTLVESAAHAEEVEVIDPVEVDFADLYDLDPLNEILAEAGEEEVTGP